MWMILTLLASVFQAFRNSFQRGLMSSAGVWAATWVRFAFGVPVSGALLLVLYIMNGEIHIEKPREFLIYSAIGAVMQIMGTMTLLKSMENSSFALGATLQHSSLAITAVFGFFVLGDNLGLVSWLGILIASIGMVLASWPKATLDKDKIASDIAGGLWGLGSGICFAISVNSFRGAVLAVSPDATLFASALTVTWVQFTQGLGLGLYLFLWQRQNLFLAVKSWRQSLSAGAMGSAASIMWFLALGLAPAALIKAINLLIESPASIIIGAIKFKERLPFIKLLAIALILLGVIATIMPQLA